MLKRVGQRYVWFDLFCIPQTDGSERAAIEISRQASIFRHSKRCVAWLSQCPSWNGVLSAFRWLAFDYHRTMNRPHSQSARPPGLHRFGNDVTDDDSATAVGMFAAANVSTELMRSDHTANGRVGQVEPWFKSSDEVYQINEQPDPWFTSLWTLQEAVLCPEIELYSRDWQRLEVVDGEPLSLTTFAVLLSSAVNSHPAKVPFSQGTSHRLIQINPAGAGVDLMLEFPKGARDLVYLVFLTQVNQVLTDLSPMRVLAAAGQRQYTTQDRSAAIMSAIGVTEWYHPDRVSESRSGDSSDHLILGNYSILFIREAARKIGALFFTMQPHWEKFILD